MRISTAARVGLAGAIATVAFGLAACGDDDDDSGGEETAGPTSVTAVASEFAYELSATPTAETTELTLENDGKLPHALIFARINEGYTLDEAFELQGRQGSAEEILQLHARPGKSQTRSIDVELEPGTYAMVCPIPAGGGETHYSLGQRLEFTIE